MAHCFFDNLINKIKHKPVEKKDYYYSFITNKSFRGLFGRMRMWNERILPACYEFEELELAKGNKIETNISNHFFRSRMKILDKTNNRKLTIYSPIFSSILSYIFGSYIKIKLEEYNPSCEPNVSYEENYPSLERKFAYSN